MSAPEELDPQVPQVAPETAEAIEQRFASLPWWKRPRRLSRQLAGALTITALLAVATFGGLNYLAARDLLVRGVEVHLEAVGALRADTISAGLDRLAGEVAAASADLSISRTLEEFSTAFADLDEEQLAPNELADLDAWYEEQLIGPLNEAGLGPFTTDDLVPVRPAAQWVQYHYTVRPPGEPPSADAGDGTAYSEVNARVTESIRNFSDAKGGGDVLLIDEAGTVVYSLDKGNDVGTNLVTGPYSELALAQVVTDSLPLAPVGSALLTDFSVSATGEPALFAVAAVSSGTQVVGAIAVEIPVALLNSVISSNGDWESVGLGDGDAYLVGADLVLQSEPRAWTEDPEGYLERLRSGDEADKAEADVIEFVGSPVGIQTIDTVPVQTALDGEAFSGGAKNYFGDATYAASDSFRAGDQQWVVVSEVPRSTVVAPLNEYVLQILIVLAIVLPVVAGLGIWVSRLFTRPIKPTVEAAEAVVDGERHPDVDIARPDEFGDLGRRLSAMAGSLAAHEAELADEYERTRQLLLSVLPPDLVDADGKVVGNGEASAHATVAAVNLSPSDERQGADEVSAGLWRAAELAETVAERTGLRRVRIAADRYLFLAGIDAEDSGADAALEFATLYRKALDDDDSDVLLDLHVGLSTGAVATGVFERGSLTFGAWGDPVRRALALASLSQVDAVLVDATTAQVSAEGRWPLERARDVVDLDGEPMDLFTLHADDNVAAARY